MFSVVIDPPNSSLFLHLENDLKTNTQSTRTPTAGCDPRAGGRLPCLRVLVQIHAGALHCWLARNLGGSANKSTGGGAAWLAWVFGDSRLISESKLPFRGENWSCESPQPQTNLSIQGIGWEVKHRWASTTSARAGFGFVSSCFVLTQLQHLHRVKEYMVLLRF